MLSMPRKIYFLSLVFILFGAFSIKAQDKKENSTNIGNTKSEIKEYINHHVLDSYDFDLLSYTKADESKVYVGIPLPIILWDGGLVIFSSSNFNHGKSLAQFGEKYYTLYHGKIYKTDSSGKISYDIKQHVLNKAPLDFSITKGVASIIFVSIIMFVLFTNLANSYKKNGMIAKGLGRFFEPIILYVRDEIAIPNIGIKYYKRYMSYLLTLFFFIWFCNMIGLTPLGINVTGNIAVTFCLALLTFIITNVTGKKEYWKHIFWAPGVPLPMKFLLAPIELLGVLIKPFSLMIRLYANISAGHIVMMTLISMIFIFRNWVGSSMSFMLAFFISIIEILVALLQAYIFTILSALYFGFAVEEQDH